MMHLRVSFLVIAGQLPLKTQKLNHSCNFGSRPHLTLNRRRFWCMYDLCAPKPAKLNPCKGRLQHDLAARDMRWETRA